MRLLVKSKGMLFRKRQGPLAAGEFTSSRDRETDYKIQSVLSAPIITPEEYEELKTNKEAGKTTNEENATCTNHY